MDSPYYSELKLCGGVVMISFLKYLPWQAMHFCVQLGKSGLWNPTRIPAIQSRSEPMQFLGFSNHEKGALRQRNFEVINGL
jgi:hypothetical protein